VRTAAFLFHSCFYAYDSSTLIIQSYSQQNLYFYTAQRSSTAVSHLKRSASSAVFAHCDVTSWTSQVSAFKAALALSPHKSLDIVFPSAGLGANTLSTLVLPPGLGPNDDPPEPPTSVLDVNFKGVYYSVVLALHYFHKTAGASGAPSSPKHLMLISSLAGLVSNAGMTDYQATKFGVRGMFRSLRAEADPARLYAVPQGIRYNLICPTFVKSNMTAGMDDYLAGIGVHFAELGDAVEGIARVLADESIRGRVLVVTRGDPPGSGIGSFDVGDDMEGGDASTMLYKKAKEGVLGKGFIALTQTD